MPKLLIIILSTIFTLNSFTLIAQSTDELQKLDNWEAGNVVSEASILIYGIENCFKILEISDDIFSRIYQKSFKTNCTTPRNELRYIKVLHRNAENEILIGEIICHQSISQDVIEILRTLYDNHYPIQQMVLIDNYDASDQKSMQANNSSGFNFRYIAGTQKLSNHSLGLAIDINPLQNPYVKKNKNGKLIVDPIEGEKYVNRDLNDVYMIKKGDLCYNEFIHRGFTWGGNWQSSKDYQHFEKQQ